MANYNNPATPRALSQQEFLGRITNLRADIDTLTSDIKYIAQLHQRTLGSTDGQANQQLEQYVSQTQIRNTAIKDGIKGLERDLANTQDSSRNIKKTQLDSLKSSFKAKLDEYKGIEHEYEHRYRDQIARQYRIVNPDASEDEVQQASTADWGNEGVFQTAVCPNPSFTSSFSTGMLIETAPDQPDGSRKLYSGQRARAPQRAAAHRADSVRARRSL